jgi:hypothetical protein
MESVTYITVAMLAKLPACATVCGIHCRILLGKPEHSTKMQHATCKEMNPGVGLSLFDILSSSEVGEQRGMIFEIIDRKIEVNP